MSSVCGFGIAVAEQNHYDYNDFTEWLESMGGQAYRMIKANPSLIPYTPKFSAMKDMPSIAKYNVYESKEDAIAKAKYLYYLFGVESKYSYSHKGRRVHMVADHQKSDLHSNPIIRRWFFGK